jgi:hypothetical protein
MKTVWVFYLKGRFWKVGTVLFNQGDQIGRIFVKIDFLIFCVFVKFALFAQILGRFLHRKSYVGSFGKLRIGLQLGRFFHKSIRSPCLQFTTKLQISDGNLSLHFLMLNCYAPRPVRKVTSFANCTSETIKRQVLSYYIKIFLFILETAKLFIVFEVPLANSSHNNPPLDKFDNVESFW